MVQTVTHPIPPKGKIPFYRVLYVQVLFAIVIGGLLGWLYPVVATNDWVKAMGDGFIKLIKMVIAPSSSAPWSPASPM